MELCENKIQHAYKKLLHTVASRYSVWPGTTQKMVVCLALCLRSCSNQTVTGVMNVQVYPRKAELIAWMIILSLVNYIFLDSENTF